MKPLMTQSSPASCPFLSVRSKCSSQRPENRVWYGRCSNFCFCYHTVAWFIL